MALSCATLALGLVVGCGDDEDEPADTAATPAAEEGGGDASAPIKIGILSDCEGAFGSFFEPTASGANLALIRHAGGKPAGEAPTDGIEGAEINGHPDRDRRLRLRGRHRRQGDRGDPPPDGAGGRGRPRRPALG